MRFITFVVKAKSLIVTVLFPTAKNISSSLSKYALAIVPVVSCKVLVSSKPSITSLPPECLKRTFEPLLSMVLLPAPPVIVTLALLLIIESLPAPPEIFTFSLLVLLIVSLPAPPSIETFSAEFSI